jgi:hypothetical protein
MTSTVESGCDGFGCGRHWNSLTEPVNDAVYSSYSTNDNVLKYL